MTQSPRRLPFPGYHRVISGLISDRPSIRSRIVRSSSEVFHDILAKKKKNPLCLWIGWQLYLRTLLKVPMCEIFDHWGFHDFYTILSISHLNILNNKSIKKTRTTFPFLLISFFCESLPVQDFIWSLSDRYLFRILKCIYKFHFFRLFHKNSPKDYTSVLIFTFPLVQDRRSILRIQNHQGFKFKPKIHTDRSKWSPVHLVTQAFKTHFHIYR